MTCAGSTTNWVRLLATVCVMLWLASIVGAAVAVELQVSTFKVDVTPPIGSPLVE